MTSDDQAQPVNQLCGKTLGAVFATFILHDQTLPEVSSLARELDLSGFIEWNPLSSSSIYGLQKQRSGRCRSAATGALLICTRRPYCPCRMRKRRCLCGCSCTSQKQQQTTSGALILRAQVEVYPRPLMRYTEELYRHAFGRYGDFRLRENGAPAVFFVALQIQPAAVFTPCSYDGSALQAHAWASDRLPLKLASCKLASQYHAGLAALAKMFHPTLNELHTSRPNRAHLPIADYCFGEKKFGGNAQAITRKRWLHHTTFLWDFDASRMELLKHPANAPDYREVRPGVPLLRLMIAWYSTSIEYTASVL